MEYEGSQRIVVQKEVLGEEEKSRNEIHQPLNAAGPVRKVQTPKNRSSKVKSKFTIRAKTQTASRRKSKSKIVKEEAIVPYIPGKVFRILSILRHDKFLKVVTRFFKPTKKTSAWNFDRKSRKPN